jgi:hypothetical protein
MPSSRPPYQPIPAGPFRTPVVDDDTPRNRPQTTTPTAKRAASAAILTGEAGGNLVLSRLQSWGIPAQPAMPGVSYDLIADVPNVDMLRVQVKTRTRPKGQVCSFSMSRGQYYSPAGMFRYSADDYDIAAFVCLSLGQVFFCLGPIHRISVRAMWLRSPGIDRDTFNLALQSLQRRRQTERLSWLATMEPEAPLAVQAAPSVQTMLPY